MDLFLGSLHYAINKRKTINVYLHSSKRISSNFDEEIPIIKERFMKADYSLRFFEKVVNKFQKGKPCGGESRVLSIKGIVLVVQVRLVKPNAMQKLDNSEDNNSTKRLEPSKHLQRNINYCFTWPVISNAP